MAFRHVSVDGCFIESDRQHFTMKPRTLEAFDPSVQRFTMNPRTLEALDPSARGKRAEAPAQAGAIPGRQALPIER